MNPSNGELEIETFARSVDKARQRAHDAAQRAAGDVSGDVSAVTGDSPPDDASHDAAGATAGAAPGDASSDRSVAASSVGEELSGQLVASIEELQVAEEELRAQNAALMEAQEALQFEQQQYRTLFESAPYAYLVTDAYGTVRMANRAAATLLNARADFLVGKPLMTFVALDDRPAFRERVNGLAKAADAIPPAEMSLELRPRRGEPVRGMVTIARAVNVHSGSVTLLWMIRDTPARPPSAPGWPSRVPTFEESAAVANRETIAELRHVNTELKAANRETLALLHREQKLRRALERAESAKAHFFAVLSHELRTPLQAIFGYTELLARELKDLVSPTQREFLLRIQRSERHLLALINNVLDFERMTRGSPVQFDVGPIPVADVLVALESMVSAQAEAKGVSLVFECADAALVAAGDRGMVQQVLVNLLTNAIKFTPRGGEVSVDARQRGDDTVAIVVCDSGRGIPADKLERIFEPFAQVRARDAQEGAGLGLAISRNIARALGGELLAQSSPGEGSRFTLTLPLAHPETSNPAPSA